MLIDSIIRSIKICVSAYMCYALDMNEDINIRIDSPCEKGYSTKNGKNVCKRTQIFRQLFTEVALDTTLWKHKVEIASEPDYEFVTFVSSDEITFLKDGKLHIKPQIKDDDFVNGELSLQNCTAKPISELCERKSYSYFIIPPIVTGCISTEDSFTFRYGSIQIKAKLPLGDWIIPEIRLLSKDRTPGGNHPFAEIRLALSRGNHNLKCDDKEIGNNYLECGLYVYSPDGQLENVTFSKYINEKWSYRYHNFTVVWDPDNISFLIDNEILGSVSPMNVSFSKINQSTPTKSEQNPFDREFYFSLGVSAGGIKEFPDNCYSNQKIKPWTNNSPKAMLHFWQARDDWKNSWTNNKTLLQVEHVRVYAL